MKYKISNAYIIVNGENIKVGTVLGQDDSTRSPFSTETIPNSEYEAGLKSFKYGKQKIDDLVFHFVGRFVNFKAERHIDDKWIKELALMGYDTSKLINVE